MIIIKRATRIHSDAEEKTVSKDPTVQYNQVQKVLFTSSINLFIYSFIYLSILQILVILTEMCSHDECSQEQRLLRNMKAHQVVLDLLEVPYDKVNTHLIFLSIYVSMYLCIYLFIYIYYISFYLFILSLLLFRRIPKCQRLCSKLTNSYRIFVEVMTKTKYYSTDL